MGECTTRGGSLSAGVSTQVANDGLVAGGFSFDLVPPVFALAAWLSRGLRVVSPPPSYMLSPSPSRLNRCRGVCNLTFPR